MEILKNDIITLDDNQKYLVVSKVTYEDNKYLYLINIDNDQDIVFCCEEFENDKLNIVELYDDNIINKLVLLFAEDTKDMLEEIESQ